MFPDLHIALPGWVQPFLSGYPKTFMETEERMKLTIALSLENVRNGLMGPFGAAIFDEQGRLVAPGINMVTAYNNSVLHAETVAIMLAQKRLGNYDLSDGGRRRLSLFASTEPCAMCFGAVCWSGIQVLVCGAKSEDAESVGFDEGPKTSGWVSELNDRGIEVVLEVCREEAAAVHREYLESGGVVY